MRLVPDGVQMALPTMPTGMTSFESRAFDDRVKEWHDKGFIVLLDHEGVTSNVVLFKPKYDMNGKNIGRVDEFRGSGNNPLAAIISAGAKYGQSVLF